MTVELLLIGYGIWAIAIFIVIAYLCFFESDIDNTFVGDLLDTENFNVVGRIIISLLIYIIFPGTFLVDILYFFKIIFTFHPPKREKKVKKSDAEVLAAQIEYLEHKYELLDKEVSRIKETIFVGDGGDICRIKEVTLEEDEQ